MVILMCLFMSFVASHETLMTPTNIQFRLIASILYLYQLTMCRVHS